ncbi:MAG: tRNA lysidine(34) synthetase TilS [Bryobacterales bacterium]|nr:tRNA lysidine(34) synthetase TilS [Bryobacterales bacterium]
MSPKDFPAAVRAAILRYNMLPAGARLGVAVSGGRDSVVLLHVLSHLSAEFEWTLVVLHLNHCLRGAESDADEQFVAELAKRSQLVCAIRRADVAGQGGNLEQQARLARRRFFAEAAQSHHLHRIATGHTQSDQAETVLFRILRGTGTAGLRGILPVTAEGVVRPMLWCSRQAVAAYAAACDLAWRDDSSNENRQFARNRLRHGLLPQLEKEWNPRLAAALSHCADVARDEEVFWAEQIDRTYASLVLDSPPGAIVLDAQALALYPLALRRRLIRKAVDMAKGDGPEAGFEAVETVLGLLGRSAGAVTLPGLAARLSFGQLRLGRACDSLVSPIPIGYPGRFSFGRKTVVLDQEGYNEGELSGVSLDGEKLTGALRLRGWVAGDAYQPIGFSSVHKLHDLFQKGRVPYWERAAWPIMVMSDQIVWASRFGPAAQFAAGPETRKVLRIRELSSDT